MTAFPQHQTNLKVLLRRNYADTTEADSPSMQMVQIEKTPRFMGKRAQEALPLPRRWQRARRWSTEKGLGKVDISGLRLMLAAEARGQG